jgi:hypothetical protein
MAFPLTFCDQQGVIRRYLWSDYPMLVAQPMEPVMWTSDPIPVTMAMPVRVRVYCGPPAPLPKRSWTADEWCLAVLRWLFR